MGRKPVLGVASVLLAGVTLLGCESSRPYQGNRSIGGGGGTPMASTPSQSWGSQPGTVVSQPTGMPGGTATRQMPAGQPSGLSSPMHGTTGLSSPSTPVNPYAPSPYRQPTTTTQPAYGGTPSSPSFERAPSSSPALSAPAPSNLNRPPSSSFPTTDPSSGTRSSGGFTPINPPSAPMPPTSDLSAPGLSSPGVPSSRGLTTSPPAVTAPSTTEPRTFDVNPPVVVTPPGR